MHQQQIINEDLGLCPSFNCYSSDSHPSATAAANISRQLQQLAGDLNSDEFEFSLLTGTDELTDSDGRTVFPLFNRDLHIQNDDVDREIECPTNTTTNSLEKLFITERDGSGSGSTSESESENEAPAVFCVWRHNGGASPLSKCKKSSSTGSGSKRWRIRDYLLRRSNSEGKDPMMLLPNNNNNNNNNNSITNNKKDEITNNITNNKKGETTKRKVNESKQSSSPIHEYFDVQQREKNGVVKRKSYLPYRQGLVGFFR
ncbi:uncharacterized protein LOC143616220 [Bidens hawaiensis]|uniref:uncharacterized protein LOC143616220 n=1 Tax=Bidens hawaiensis TaxID=980011 RepID=UPI00404A4C76